MYPLARGTRRFGVRRAHDARRGVARCPARRSATGRSASGACGMVSRRRRQRSTPAACGAWRSTRNAGSPCLRGQTGQGVESLGSGHGRDDEGPRGSHRRYLERRADSQWPGRDHRQRGRHGAGLDLAAGSCRTVLAGHEGHVWSVAVLPDGVRTRQAAGQDRTVRIWDLESGGALEEFHGHTDAVWSVAVLAGPPDDRFRAAGTPQSACGTSVPGECVNTRRSHQGRLESGGVTRWEAAGIRKP